MEESDTKAKNRWHKAQTQVMATNEVLQAIKEEKERIKKSKLLKKACINVFKFFLSTAGLALLNGLFLFLGAYLFRHLELPNEKEGCVNSRKDYQEAENATLILLMDMAQQLDGLGTLSDDKKQKIVDDFQIYLQEFASSVLSTGYEVGTDCESLTEDDYGWSFTGSLVFALTVTTTIGYGHISPTTKWGRLICIAYAVIGIPMFLLFLANIGEVFANLFRITYSTLCCCGCCRKKEEKELTPEEEEKEKAELEKAAQVWRIDPETGRPIPPEEEEEEEVEEEDGEEEGEDDGEEEELTVPLTISVLVLVVIIVMGAFIFDFYEEDWDYLASVYYCAVTATTIGFGDYVPSTSLKDGGGVVKAVVVIIYIVISMAAISMCFQLLADEVIAKFKWIGEKLAQRKADKARREEEGETDELKA